MQLKKVKLTPLKGNDKILSANVNGNDMFCWLNDEVCTSLCAAWRIKSNMLMCMALPKDQRIGKILYQKKEEIPDPPNPPEKRIVKEGARIQQGMSDNDDGYC